MDWTNQEPINGHPVLVQPTKTLVICVWLVKLSLCNKKHLIIFEPFHARTKRLRYYFFVITLHCKTAHQWLISIMSGLAGESAVSLVQWLCGSCWAVRTWGEQVCFTVHFGVIIEMDGQIRLLLSKIYPQWTVDQPAPWRIPAQRLFPPVTFCLCLHIPHHVLTIMEKNTYLSVCFFFSRSALPLHKLLSRRSFKVCSDCDMFWQSCLTVQSWNNESISFPRRLLLYNQNKTGIGFDISIVFYLPHPVPSLSFPCLRRPVFSLSRWRWRL